VVPRENPALDEVVDDDTAAILIEPVQGESGIWPVGRDVLEAARELCDETGALLIFDEIQCGMGRTGTLWAWEQAGVRPDVMTVAKGLGGGLPIGACIAAPDHAEVFEPGDHGSTFAGSPLVTAAAGAVLGVVDDDAFLAEVRRKGELLREGLTRLELDVRGGGLMLAFLLDQRLVLNAPAPDAVRLLPPLTVSDDEIAEAVERIGALLRG
jgi:acetylornithine/succinyldiaminopimelate/putrescine aminotransferase